MMFTSNQNSKDGVIGRISWPVSHKFCPSENNFSGCMPYLNIFEYSNMKLNECTIFEYYKNLHLSDALVLLSLP